MKKLIVGILLTVSIATPAWAINYTNNDAMLNKVIFRLSAEQWVATKSALVTIGVSSAVTDKKLDALQDNVLKKLGELSAQSEWHITDFDRSLDQSGLEKVQISAQSRLPFAVLSDLRNKTKAMSKPGETYTLDSVQFTPSEADIRAANVLLRENIYQQTKDEMDRVSKTYNEKYYVHDVNFVDAIVIAPLTQNMYMQNKMAMTAASPANNSMAVSDKIILTAVVTLSSMPDQSIIKLTQ